MVGAAMGNGFTRKGVVVIINIDVAKHKAVARGTGSTQRNSGCSLLYFFYNRVHILLWGGLHGYYILTVAGKKVARLRKHPPQACRIGLRIEARHVGHTLLLSVGGIADNAHRYGIIDVETVPAWLNLIEVPEISILAIVGINLFSRLFRFAHVLLSFVQNVAYFHL